MKQASIRSFFNTKSAPEVFPESIASSEQEPEKSKEYIFEKQDIPKLKEDTIVSISECQLFLTSDGISDYELLRFSHPAYFVLNQLSFYYYAY